MNDNFDNESRQALIDYRLSRAYETLKEAELLCEGKFYNATINRLYYACYYAAVALLLKNNVSAQAHSGVKTMLGLHFVSKGLLTIENGKLFTALFEKRHSGDYDDFVFCDREMVDELTPKAKEFIDAVKDLIGSK